jgi:monomeric sarcosine oxidase
LTPTYDTIVIGLGGMGSAALYELVQRGQRVLGLEQFDIAHDRGSSHGQTRLIRRAYFEHPDYVPLVERAYQRWHNLEAASGRPLLRRSGLFLAGRGDGGLIPGVDRAASVYRLPIQNVPTSQCLSRFPGLIPDEDMEVRFEADAGYLLVEDCVLTHVEQARRHGATIVTRTPVRVWLADETSVTVRTDECEYSAGSLIVCGGPWSSALLSSLDLPLEVRRKLVFWFPIGDDRYLVERGCPAFAFETREGFFYGFPAIDGRTVKVGEHTGGQAIAGVDQLDRRLLPEDAAPVQRFIRRHLPGLRPDVQRHSVCMYTMTPDEDFIVDRHPHYPNVAYAAGFSGHGFKFAPVIGSILADLVMTGRTEEPVEFLRADRPALRVRRPSP